LSSTIYIHVGGGERSVPQKNCLLTKFKVSFWCAWNATRHFVFSSRVCQK